MQVTISCQHVDITNAWREYVRRKLTRINRHFGSEMRCHVVLHITKNRHPVETTAHTKGAQWHATAEHKDACTAIDRVVDKLDRQAIKHKVKVVDHYQEKGGLKYRPTM